MGKKTILVLLVGLTLAPLHTAEGQQSRTFALSGTLVVAVPSRDGLIVAADSRTVVAGKPETGKLHCDNAVKIIEPTRAARTAGSVVGNALFIEPPGPNDSDFCDYFKRARRSPDVQGLVRRYLETESADVSTSEMEKFALQCVAAVQQLYTSSPSTLKPFAGRALFQVIVMGYDPKTRTALIRDFTIRLSSEPITAEAGKITSRKFSLESKREITLFGEGRYFNTQVIGGVGRKFLRQETIRFIRQETSVGTTNFLKAVTAAIDIIDATSKTTDLVPPTAGIGGPIDVLLLGNEPRPRRVQWKSE